jgi:hypothetical protein
MMNTTITDEEESRLHAWIDEDNSFEDNPWMMTDETGRPLNFITAWRTMLELKAEHESA